MWRQWINQGDSRLFRETADERRVCTGVVSPTSGIQIGEGVLLTL